MQEGCAELYLGPPSRTCMNHGIDMLLDVLVVQEVVF